MSRALDELARLRAYQLQTERDIDREVWEARARLNPVPWSQIGAALGISKQAAQKRFRHLDDAEKPSAMIDPAEVWADAQRRGKSRYTCPSCQDEGCHACS